VVRIATMRRHAPQKPAVQIMRDRRPEISARKPPAMIATDGQHSPYLSDLHLNSP
jgi:hypothetical protein